eukprot:4818436-Pleurochrysis_carterae.AAC.1
MLRRSCHRALTLPPDGRSPSLRSVHTPLLAAPRRGVCKALACACLLVSYIAVVRTRPRAYARARAVRRARATVTYALDACYCRPPCTLLCLCGARVVLLSAGECARVAPCVACV